MENLLTQTFSDNEFGDIRVIMDDKNEPWFVGREIAEKLGYSNTSDALVKHVDPEDKQILQKSRFATFEIPPRGLTIINESGLYSLVLSSKLESAKRFKRWITSEVLPTICKHGMYVEPQKLTELLQKPESIIAVLETLQKEQEERIRLQNQIEADAPATKFGKQLQTSDGTICLRAMWKLLKDHGCDIKQPAFFKSLRDADLIFQKGTQPTAKAQDMGILECKTTLNADGTQDMIHIQGVVTTKGIQYFLNYFLNQEVC
ncbi:MAG: phage antirepressor [Thermoguttaceae bacterium]